MISTTTSSTTNLINQQNNLKNLNQSNTSSTTTMTKDLFKSTNFCCEDNLIDTTLITPITTTTTTVTNTNNSCNFWTNCFISNPIQQQYHQQQQQQIDLTLSSSSTSTISSNTKIIDTFTMPVGIPTNQNSTTLDTVYNSTNNSSTTITERNLMNNPYYNNYNNTNTVPYNVTYNPYYQLTANTLRNPSTAAFANYLGTAAAAGVNYYNNYNTNLTNFDYTNYNNTNNYYNSTSTASTTNLARNIPYYNGHALSSYNLTGLTDTITSPTTSNQQQISPYSSIIKNDIKTNSTTTTRRNKKKKNISLTTTELNYSRVFIYEIDDICPFLTGLRQNYNILGTIIDRILTVAFQLQHIDECDQTNIEDAIIDDIIIDNQQQQQQQQNNLTTTTNSPDSINIKDDDISTSSTKIANENLHRMAMRYQRIKMIYNQCRDNLQELLNIIDMSNMPINQLNEIIKQADVYTLFENYNKCLKISIDRNGIHGETYTNIIMSSEPLSIALAKLLLTGLSSYVPVENVYSFHKLGEPEVFDRIINRYKKISIVISSNQNTRELAQKEKVPFWRVGCPTDIEKFHIALDQILLNTP